MYTIKQASALTGVPADTLRAWERRYAIGSPDRSAGGYRLYDERSLATLRTMKCLVAAGWPARNAAALASGATAGVPGPVEFVDRIAAGSLTDSQRDAVLAGLFLIEPLPALIDDWLMPMLAELGTRWSAGGVSVWQEHATAAAVMRRLAATFEALPVAPGAPVVLAGLPEGDRHEVGLLAFAVLARSLGAHVVYLGPDLPRNEWVAAAARYQPRAVVTAAHSADDAAQARDLLAALPSPGRVLAVGGARQDALADLAVPLGHRLGPAADRLVALVSPAP